MKVQYVQGKPIFTSINKDKRQFKYLDYDLETDVCIIGGGVTGAIAGYYFSKNNVPSVIIDKKRIAHLSTSVTTSLLQYELDDKLSDLTEYTTIKNAIKSYNLGLKALDEIEEFINTYGNECLYEKKDTLLYTDKKDEVNGLKQEFDLRLKNGFDVEYIDDTNNPFSFDVKAGIISKNGGAQLDPFRFTHQLIKVSESIGLKVFENTEAVRINYLNDGVEVITEYGYKIKCKKIIVATGYNTNLFTKRNFATMTTTFNVATAPVNNFDGWNNKILIRDNNDPYNYLRTTPDNRLIIGGEDISFSPGIFDSETASIKYNILENRLKSMFPSIRDIIVDYRYCGAFASTPDNLGFIGPDPNHPNLWYCLGYGANGILFAILGGMWLSDLYLGKTNSDMDLFKINRFDN